MENEAQRPELEKVEEVEEEEEETTLLQVRKSRTEKNGSKLVTETCTIVPGLMNGKLISESEGQAIQSTLTPNGARKEESTLVMNIDEMKEKPDGVLENEAENLVFFDKDEGIWKCRICSWTYQNGSVCIDHIQNHNGQFHKPMHDNILNFETEGVGHGKMEILSESYKASEEIESVDTDLIDGETEYDVETVLQKQKTHDLYCPNCNSCITRRVILRKRKRTKLQISVKRNKTVNPPVQASDEQVHPHQITGAEEDVGCDTGPDLFRCLSCFSFFIPTGNGFKFWKFGDKSRKKDVRDEQVSCIKNLFTSIFASRGQDTGIEQDVPPASEPLLGTMENNDTLECEDEILLSPRHEHSTNGLVVPHKTTEKIDAKTEPHEVVAGYHLKEPLISNEQFEVVSGYHLKEPIRTKEQLTVFAGYHLKEPIRRGEEVEVIAGYHLKEPVISKDVQVTHGSDLLVTTHLKEPIRGDEEVKVMAGYHLKEPVISTDVQVTHGSDLQVTTHLKEPIRGDEEVKVIAGYHLKEPVISKDVQVTHGSDLLVTTHLKEPLRGDEEVKIIAGYHLKEPVISKDVQVTHGSDLLVTTLTVDTTEIVVEEPAQDATSVSRKGGSNLLIFSNDGQTTIKKPEEGKILIQTAQKGNTGMDTLITIDSYPASEIIQGIVIPAETAIPTQTTTQTGIPVQERTEDARRNSKIEILKSIVYGGLAELIASLSIVSSAAAGDATTLNILALGMANLIGGFFVICHNLWELRCEQTDQVTDQRDRYQELLGQRRNFKLHAIVCILSYIVFGLTPIIVYGFSFRQSEERELKLVVVGAVSLVCIITLSIGKAYVCRPPKPYVKTIANFVVLGFMASGISYAAGVLVKRFLERLGLFQSTSVSDMIFNQDSTWASY